MKFAVDLHIHTALSPCSDKEMTPNNIVNMACLKGLDIIAITDHNSAENVKAVMQCAAGVDVIVIPGMELETREEVHILCLFPGPDAVLKMQEKVYAALPDLKNREDIFGQQRILDARDEITGSCDRLLLTAANISVEDAFSLVAELGGAAVPAHVDRESYSILSNLGMIPGNLGVRWLELSRNCSRELLLQKHPALEAYSFLHSSDAHRLGDILERESFITLEERSAESLINTLK